MGAAHQSPMVSFTRTIRQSCNLLATPEGLDRGRDLAGWKRLVSQLDEFQGINWEEAIVDGTFFPAK